MRKLLDSDWLRAVQFKSNTSAIKSVTPVQILLNRSDVLPVNMRCTRAAVGQYEVACRGVWTCLRFFCWFWLCLVCTIFR